MAPCALAEASGDGRPPRSAGSSESASGDPSYVAPTRIEFAPAMGSQSLTLFPPARTRHAPFACQAQGSVRLRRRMGNDA